MKKEKARKEQQSFISTKDIRTDLVLPFLLSRVRNSVQSAMMCQILSSDFDSFIIHRMFSG
ncbi:MAG: hypothetical protein ACI8RD_013830 [Bacillariaceae sp.]|jgi:hypothetical protein